MFIKNYKVNDRIRAREVRVIGVDGEQIGVKSIEDALSIARSQDLDLVLMSENTTPPVCKLVNYGQFMYQQKKKDKQARKSAQVTKEVKMSPKISDNDYQVRVNKTIKFLEKRYKVKVNIFFRGREIVHHELGVKLMERFIEDVQEYGNPDSEIAKSGRSIIVTISPK